MLSSHGARNHGYALFDLEGGRTVDMYYWKMEHLREAGSNEKEISNNEGSPPLDETFADLLAPISKYYCSEMCNHCMTYIANTRRIWIYRGL